jgi:aspartyl-tRNA(Asn)/glutamyl-tRNA(Gln) amidotransferase subunit C
MSLSLEDVEHVAALARLGLTGEEMETLRDQLSSILEHIEVLNRLDVGDISPTAQVIAVDNVMRDDSVVPSLSQDRVMALVPRGHNGFIAVPAVLGDVDVVGEGGGA